MSELDDLLRGANQEQQDRQALHDLAVEHGGALCVTGVDPTLRSLVDDFLPRVPSDAGTAGYWIQRSELVTVHYTPVWTRPSPGSRRGLLRKWHRARVAAMEKERKGDARVLVIGAPRNDDADIEFPLVWLHGQWQPARDVSVGPDWWGTSYDFTREYLKTAMVRFLQGLDR